VKTIIRGSAGERKRV